AQNPPKNIASANDDIGSHEKNPLKNRNETQAGLPFALRLYYGFGSAFVNVHQSDATLANRTEQTPLFGIDYIASPYISVGLEAGSAAISELLSGSSVQPDNGG